MLMSTATTVIGLMPVLVVTGRGSDVMQPMAIPSVGGMTVQIITLFIAPCLFCLAMEWEFTRGRLHGGDQVDEPSDGSEPVLT
jgi:Cu(I)/Ag(I) efflux system membrane protein CusA/SilA